MSLFLCTVTDLDGDVSPLTEVVRAENHRQAAEGMAAYLGSTGIFPDEDDERELTVTDLSGNTEDYCILRTGYSETFHLVRRSGRVVIDEPVKYRCPTELSKAELEQVVMHVILAMDGRNPPERTVTDVAEALQIFNLWSDT